MWFSSPQYETYGTLYLQFTNSNEIKKKKQHQQAANAFKHTLHLSSSHVKFNEVAII